MFDDKVLLISGGTGSFGNAVLRRLLNSNIKEIRILSRDELKQNNMRIFYNNDKLKFYLGDVRDLDNLNESVQGVDFIFHAAALKVVPSCEFYPMEAIKTNVIGTENILNKAIEHCVKKVIVLSTDKAVYPVNVMGISKAMMERVAIAKSRTIKDNKTIISCTRYGNVMASRGSVIPAFINQIKSSSDITITNPFMTRFMMDLDNAVSLVEYAFKNGNNGDIFVKKAPGTTIENIALALIEIFNYDKKKIKIIGTRHGEKIHETLLTADERRKSIETEDYFQILPDVRDLNYNKYIDEGEILPKDYDDYSSNNTKQLDVSELVELIKKIDIN